MMLDDLIDKLERLRIDGDTRVYVRIGLQQSEVESVEAFDETDYEYGAVVIS